MKAWLTKISKPVLFFGGLILSVAITFLFYTYSGNDATRRVQSLSGFTMGTSYSIQIANEIDNALLGPLADSIQARLDYLDKALLSTFVSDSELSRFNRSQVGQEVTVAKELVEVLVLAQEINELSEGAFDITIGPLVNLWGFGATPERNEPPSQALINTAQVKLGAKDIDVSIETSTLQKNSAIEIDLSAIAKGYGVDQVAGLLNDSGVENYLVEIGGEVIVSGTKSNGTPWMLGIEAPEQSQQIAFEPISSMGRTIAVASSGDYRNFFEHDGRRYSHEIDPRTGWPISQELASVTVISDSAARADALATALLVMGLEKAVEIASRENIAVYFIIDAPSGFQNQYTNAFAPFLSAANRQ